MAEGVLLGGLAVVVTGLMVREAWCFFRRKWSLDRMEQTEWRRVVRTLRDQ